VSLCSILDEKGKEKEGNKDGSVWREDRQSPAHSPCAHVRMCMRACVLRVSRIHPYPPRSDPPRKGQVRPSISQLKEDERLQRIWGSPLGSRVSSLETEEPTKPTGGSKHPRPATCPRPQRKRSTTHKAEHEARTPLPTECESRLELEQPGPQTPSVDAPRSASPTLRLSSASMPNHVPQKPNTGSPASPPASRRSSLRFGGEG
jgi:hypothetical protein